MYSLGRHNVNTGNLREAFFYNQLLVQHDVRMSKEADFWVDEKYTFEVGGKQKNQRQIHQLTDAYIAADGIEYGHGNKIPLFLFGLMY